MQALGYASVFRPDLNLFILQIKISKRVKHKIFQIIPKHILEMKSLIL